MKVSFEKKKNGSLSLQKKEKWKSLLEVELEQEMDDGLIQVPHHKRSVEYELENDYHMQLENDKEMVLVSDGSLKKRGKPDLLWNQYRITRTDVQAE